MPKEEAMTNVLDELGYALVTRAVRNQATHEHGEVFLLRVPVTRLLGIIESIFTEFIVAHPGLIDLTTCNETCPAYAMYVETALGKPMGQPARPACVRLDSDTNGRVWKAPTGQPCPVIEGRKP
jgi:hypothetical protein